MHSLAAASLYFDPTEVKVSFMISQVWCGMACNNILKSAAAADDFFLIFFWTFVLFQLPGSLLPFTPLPFKQRQDQIPLCRSSKTGPTHVVMVVRES